MSSFSFTFTVGSGLLCLQFSDTSVNPFSVNGVAGAVGNVVVITKPVPEPETCALMLAGLGVMTFVARRRKAS